MSFTIGTATFTNGSTAVTGVSLTSGQLSYFASGTAIFVEGELIEAIGSTGSSQINLRLSWGGATGSYEFVAFDTIEGLRDAVQSARGFSAQLQSYVDGISVTPTADSIAQRDSAGRLEAAAGVSGNDVVNMGQLGTAATRDVGTSTGQLAEYTITGLSGYGYGGTVGDATSWGVDTDVTGFFASDGDVPTFIGQNCYGFKIQRGRGTFGVEFVGRNDVYGVRTRENGTNTPWRELYHTGNLSPVTTDTTQTITGRKTHLYGMSGDASFASSQIKGQTTTTVNNTGRWGIALPTSILDNYGITFSAVRYAASGAPRFEIREHNNSEVGSLIMQGDANGIRLSTGLITVDNSLTAGGTVTATNLNVSGSKNFRIDNPSNPDEYLYHSAIESDKPRTQYIIEVDVDETLEATHTMPDWFMGLNGNTCTVFCSPCKHFGAAYGEVVDGVLTVTTNAVGKYHILVMAERIDPNVSSWKLTEVKPLPEPEPEPAAATDTGTTTDTAP